MAKDLTAEVLIAGKRPADIYPLLTTAEHLCCWLAAEAEVDLAAARFCFWGRYTPGTPTHESAVVSLLNAAKPAAGASPQTVLSFNWRLRGVETTVAWQLAATETGTILRVTHTGLAERAGSQGALHDFWIVALENLRLYALSGKPQQLIEYGPKPAAAIQLAVEIQGGAAEIFRYLIEPTYVGRLWDDEKVVIEPQVGGVYDYGWEQGGPRRILALDPPWLLSFSWRYPPETADTIVTWRLSEQPGGITRLTLEHSGFAADYDDEEYRAGWFSFLAAIKGLVELGSSWTRVSVKGGQHGEV